MPIKTSLLKRAFKAAKQATEPQHYGRRGKPLICHLCGPDRFQVGEYVDLLSLHTLVCDGCKHVEFFKKLPDTIE